MGISGWTWTIFGIIIAALSGYLYLFVPRNGSPNMAMALFFFIGLAFIIIGTVKILLKRSQDKPMMNALKEPAREQEMPMEKYPMMGNINTNENSNKVELALDKAMQQAQQPSKPVMQHPNNPNMSHQHHSNTYSQLHQYKGPIHTPQGTHSRPAQAPVTHHPQASHQTQSEGITCRKCGTPNAGHAVYCHQCGNRLK